MKTSEIESIIRRIKDNEDEWKSLHMAVWNYSRVVEKDYLNEAGSNSYYSFNISNSTSFTTYINKKHGSKKVALGLPSSAKGFHEFDSKKLYTFLTSHDNRIALNNLIVIFSLFEVFLKTIAEEIYQEKVDTGTKEGIKTFLNKKEFGIEPKIINEIILAKKTRDCYIHSDSKIDSKWIGLFSTCRGSHRIRMSDGDKLPDVVNIFKEVEIWQKMIVEVSENIYNDISINSQKFI